MNLRLTCFYRQLLAFLTFIKTQIKQTTKKIYLNFQPYDGPTFFPISGPIYCDLVENIARAAGGSHTIISKENQKEFELPKGNNPNIVRFFSQCSHTQYPPVSISVIPGGHIYSDGAVFSPDGITLARDLSLDFTSPPNSHHLCGQLVHKKRILKGSTLSIASWRTSSYFHWLLDELPRCLLPNIPLFDNIVCSRDTSINKGALHLLGLKNKNILFIEKEKHLQCDFLIAPSYLAPTGHPSPYLVELLKQAVEPLIIKSPNHPEKVFISRKSARGRKITNEDTVFDFFEAQGYTRIKLEDLSWQDQINIFYHAREIFSPHGAGLANLVFCNNIPLVIEVFNAKYMHWCFWKLAMLVGANYIPLAFPETEEIEHNLKAGNLDVDMRQSDAYISIYKKLKQQI